MKNICKKGFTLAEILICLTVLGIIAMLLLPNLNTDAFTRRAKIANALKYVRIVNEASVKIKDQPQNCPTGNFIERMASGNTFGEEITFYSQPGTVVTSRTALNIFSEHIRFDDTNIDYQIRNANGQNSGGTFAAGKIAGNDVVIFFRVYDSVQDCPDYFDPSIGKNGEMVTMDATNPPKCWGELMIDTNGRGGPNIVGNNLDEDDIFRFGLAKDGVNLKNKVMDLN